MRVGDNELPGEYTDGETPVPIPNTEAKLVRPMVVRKGESRYRQDYEGLFRKEQALSISQILNKSKAPKSRNSKQRTPVGGNAT